MPQKSSRHNPRLEGRAQHARRVAAWTTAIAQSRGSSSEDQAVLQEAALSHQIAPVLLNESAWNRLLADLGVQATGLSMISPDARQVLSVFRGIQPGDQRHEGAAKLAAILEQCDQFDEHFEIEPFLDAEEPPPAEAMNALQSPHRSAIAALKGRVPVLPAAARAALTLVAKPAIELEDIYNVARSDQVLAVNIIEAANSGLWGGLQPVRDLKLGLARLGVENARKALLAGALRPMYSSSALRRAWRHAQDAAETAERIAAHTLSVRPPEAFLAGLVHDIGELRFQLADAPAQAERQRLVEQGCPPRVVEQIVFGVEHAAAGAELLLAWRFPDEFCNAIASHHCPERARSDLAALLYLVEFETCAEEDLPSLARLRFACQRLNLSWLNGRLQWR